jgi:lysophospholipase L1-like esterase
MIYVIGDSHVSVFSGTDLTTDGLRHIQPEFGTCYTLSQGQLRPLINKFEQRIPHFCPIKIGSNTAYNSFSKLPKIEQVIKEYEITETDYIFLCFGEIDIRNHIGINAEKNNITINESIGVCVDKYMETILYLNEKYKNVGVYGAPASSIGWPSTYGYKDVKFRNSMTVVFNSILKDKCDKNKILFKDISEKMILDDGTTNQEYIMDDIHLSQKAMPLILKEFNNIICKQ